VPQQFSGVVVTELLLSAPSARCQAGRRCDRAPCFQARLEAAAGCRAVSRNAELCAEHLGCTVQSLASWAREQGLEGKVTVLVIDQPAGGLAASPGLPGDWVRRGFAFGTILLDS
jgi:hypothetical protein